MAAQTEIIKVKMAPDKEQLLEKSKQEFARRRKVVLGNIPDGINLEELKKTILQGLDAMEVKFENKTGVILFKNVTDAQMGVDTLKTLNSNLSEKGITINFLEPDSLLFVGNLPFEVNEDQLGDLMSQYGKLERVFLVRSELTGESKGYGFAEYSDKKTAGEAKQQLLKSGAKYISGRILRVDFAEPNLHTYKDLHSKTLFLDKLPRNFTDGEVLRQMFSQSGKVTYAQVAISVQTGTSRGFAFVDYETSEEAERGQIAHNNAKIGDCFIRTSYGTPGRSGASVLGPCNPMEKSKPVSLMSATVPNTMIRPPPRPEMGPRPLMSGPMICPDPSAHMIRGCPMPLMAAGPQFWDPRAGFYPRPGVPGIYPGGSPHMLMGNPRGPNPSDIRGAPRPLVPRGSSPGGLQGPQGNNGPARPLMDTKPGGVGTDQLGRSAMTSPQSIASNNINNQHSPQPLMQSSQSIQQPNSPQGQQSSYQASSKYNSSNTQLSLLGQQQTSLLNSSAGGVGFSTGQGSGNDSRGPAPLMSNQTWGGSQSSYSEIDQQYSSQSGQSFPGQNVMPYQSSGQTGSYQPDYKQPSTPYNSSQSQFNQYGSQGQGVSSNNQSYGSSMQSSHATTQVNYYGSQTNKQQNNTGSQAARDLYDVFYNANKRPRF